MEQGTPIADGARKVTYLRAGGNYGLFGCTPVASVTALAARNVDEALAESDAIDVAAHAGFTGIWDGGCDLYEIDGEIPAGPLTPAGAYCHDDLPTGARFIKRHCHGGVNTPEEVRTF